MIGHKRAILGLATDGVAIVTGANMKPGDVRTAGVTITNTGSLPGVFTLEEQSDQGRLAGAEYVWSAVEE